MGDQEQDQMAMALAAELEEPRLWAARTALAVATEAELQAGLAAQAPRLSCPVRCAA